MLSGAIVESDDFFFIKVFKFSFFAFFFCFCLSGLAGLGEKVNDSLDMMFDTTAYGEYKSFTGTQLKNQPSQEEEVEDNEEEEEDAERDGGGSHCDILKRNPTLANGFIQFPFTDYDDDTMSQRKEQKAK